jgi:hypothetical protein
MLVATTAGKKPPPITNGLSGGIGIVIRTLPSASDTSLVIPDGRAGAGPDVVARSRV